MARPYRFSPEGLARRRSPEVRAKMSAARKRAWADPAVRAKMSAARKAAWADPEVRAKRWPELAELSEAELADYRVLRKAGYRKAEALAACRRRSAA